MGGALSQEEEKQLIPHLQDFDPDTLSNVIWDIMNMVGVDDEREKFGIHFDEVEENQEGNKKKDQNVVFWDGDEAQDLPFPVFMDIINYIGEETVKRYEKYKLEENKEVEPGVNKLKLAMEYLQTNIQSLHRSETTQEYRKRIDNKQSVSNKESDQSDRKKLVEGARERRGSHMWSSGELDPTKENGDKLRRGIESVTTCLPELQRRYDVQNTSKKVLSRVKHKLKVLSLFNNQDDNTSISSLDGHSSPTIIPVKVEGRAKELQDIAHPKPVDLHNSEKKSPPSISSTQGSTDSLPESATYFTSLPAIAEEFSPIAEEFSPIAEEFSPIPSFQLVHQNSQESLGSSYSPTSNNVISPAAPRARTGQLKLSNSDEELLYGHS